MRPVHQWPGVLISGAVILSGCAHQRTDKGTVAVQPAAIVAATNITYTPVLAVTGRIVMTDPKARFVIVSLAPGVVPKAGTHLFAYHGAVRAAEIRLNGTQWDDKAVADILSGNPQVNDLVNDN